MKGEPCELPPTEAQIPGVDVGGCSSSITGAVSSPATTCSWNYVEVYMDAVQRGEYVKFVEALEEITSAGHHIPKSQVETILRCVLCITDCTLLLHLYSVFAADASFRPNIALLPRQLWELMEDCCRRLLHANSVTAHTSSCPPSHPPSYSHSAHIVLLYLVSLLAADLLNHKDNVSAALVARMLSLSTQWRRVVVIVNLLLELFLLNTYSPLPLPDLPPVLASLLCMCVSCECDQQDGVTRLARELSSRVSRISSVQRKMDFLLLIPCHRLREMTINIHLQTEFLLPSNSSSEQSPPPPSEDVTLDLITTTHFSRYPCHHDGSPHLSFFLFLLFHILLSHCSRLLGPSFLQIHPHSTSWTTPPSELAQQLRSIAPQIRRLPRRLSEDDTWLPELTSPRCWFYLELLESMFKWDHISK